MKKEIKFMEGENFIYQNISLKAWIEDEKIERQEKMGVST